MQRKVLAIWIVGLLFVSSTLTIGTISALFAPGRAVAPGPGRALTEDPFSDAGGHGGGPSLKTATNASAVVRVLTEGRNLMPAFGDTLSPREIRDVVAHVGRPSALTPRLGCRPCEARA